MPRHLQGVGMPLWGSQLWLQARLMEAAFQKYRCLELTLDSLSMSPRAVINPAQGSPRYLRAQEQMLCSMLHSLHTPGPSYFI